MLMISCLYILVWYNRSFFLKFIILLHLVQMRPIVKLKIRH